MENLYKYIINTGYSPTFEELRGQLNVSSNQLVIDLLTKLENKELIKRNESQARSITILPLGYKVLGQPPMVPFLGITHVGSPIGAIEISGQWQTVSSDVVLLKDEIFLLKITGDSMQNVGIDEGDMVLVKSQKEFVSGDIVLADVDGESTIKRFISEDKPPYLYLRPENPKYDIIYFTESVTLKGKVVSVLKTQYWKPSD